MSIRKIKIGVVLMVALTLAGCAVERLGYSTSGPALVQATLRQAGITDRRAEFRQAFCGLMSRDSANPADNCEQWLTRFADEPAASLGEQERSAAIPTVDLVIVPGIFAECVSDTVTVFADAAARLRELKYHVTYAPIRGRAGAASNALIIRNHILDQQDKYPGHQMVVVSYSKGTTDTMTALVNHPELHQRVAALISVAGVVNGSPLADQLESLYTATAGAIDLRSCPLVDGNEIDSLTRRTRLSWLQTNTLPTAPLYFSIVAVASPDRVSRVMRPFYNKLAEIEPLNDGQVLSYDAILPGGVLLGFANADHFAVAIPFETVLSSVSLSVLDQNRFPRAQLIEAAVQIVERALAERSRAKLATKKDFSHSGQ